MYFCVVLRCFVLLSCEASCVVMRCGVLLLCCVDLRIVLFVLCWCCVEPCCVSEC